MTTRAVWKHHRRLGYWSPLGDYQGKLSRVQQSGRKYAVIINDRSFTTRATAEAAMQAADEIWEDLRRRSPDDPAAALPQLGLGDRPNHASKKTAAQLDREIAETLAGEHYYFTIDRNEHRTIYGPFETLKEAEYAGYFAKPVSERDSQPANIYFMRGVQRYDADEIRSLSDYPGEYDLKSVKLKRGNPPVHPSWRAFDKTDKTFRVELRDKDYEHYQLIMRR